MQSRFNKIIFNAYENEKLNIIKDLVQNKLNWNILRESIKNLAWTNAIELKELLTLKNNWIKNQEFFKNWAQREITDLKLLWIQNKELKKLGFIEIINAYKHLINILEKTKATSNLQNIKIEEIRRRNNLRSIHLRKIHVDKILYDQPSELNPKIYAPIRKLKNKMKIWKMLSKSGIPKACGRFLVLY
jgi:hypothetical protein